MCSEIPIIDVSLLIKSDFNEKEAIKVGCTNNDFFNLILFKKYFASQIFILKYLFQIVHLNLNLMFCFFLKLIF